MKAVVVALAAVLSLASWAQAEDCGDCHTAAAREFAATAMARAAATDDFLREWSEKGRDGACLGCHALSGGIGVSCRDCHGGGEHPFAPASAENCARCHDAPGENTLRSYRASRAAAQGNSCLACHLSAKEGRHRFLGPSDPGFLDGVADLRLMTRHDEGQRVVVAQIRHRAGHALPGGTTGRSVWLVVTGRDAAGGERWRESRRFGWVITEDGRWQDHTLRGDIGVTLEFVDPGEVHTFSVEAALVYRFAAGPIEKVDARQVELSRATMTLR